MKRRNFIKALGATTAVAALGSKKVQADTKKYKWKMVTSWPKNFPGLGVGAENLAKMINDLSGGRIKIKVFGLWILNKSQNYLGDSLKRCIIEGYL